MSLQCPACSSYNDDGAVFCGQCGSGLGGGPGRSSGFSNRILGVVLLAIIGVVAFYYFPRDGEDPKPGPDDAVGVTPPPSGDDVPKVRERSVGEDRDAREPTIVDRSDDAAEEKSSEEIRRAGEASIVVIELKNEEGRLMPEISGVIVSDDGVVLCSLSPLLGAHTASVRLGNRQQRRAAVSGVSFYDERRDLALIRLRGEPTQGLSFLDGPVAETFAAGDELHVFTGFHHRPARVERASYLSGNGLTGMRLAQDPPVVPEAFVAVDSLGFLAGICRPLIAGRAVVRSDPRTRQRSEGAVGVMVLDVYDLGDHVAQSMSWTLSQLTQELFEGTFADLSARAERAYRRQLWGEAADLFARAFHRSSSEPISEADIDQVLNRFSDSSLREIQRLESADRLTEAAAVAESAIGLLPGEPSIWIALAGVRLRAGQLRESIDALLESRALEENAQVDKRLQQVYIAFAADGMSKGDERFVEDILVEAIDALPDSGVLRFELGKLYHRWEAFDDALRLYESARKLDGKLDSEVELLISKIDDVLRRRDAVVIPLAPNSKLIQTTVALNGKWEFPFIVDTGASDTTLPRNFAEEMGLDVDRGERVRLTTAGGTVYGRRVRVDSIDLGGYSVRNIQVIVLPAEVRLSKGLLGNNFLNFFKYSVDRQRGEFRLERP